MNSSPTAEPISGSITRNKSMNLLSLLLLSHDAAEQNLLGNSDLASFGRAEFADLVALANSNHVVMRALALLKKISANVNNLELEEWCAGALEAEGARIQNAVDFLHSICGTLQSEGCGVMVIKSLDHWPDLGSDLDLYTDASPVRVIGLMRQHFNARTAERSWGDRLANKWNFEIPGLPELVEVHMGRLGQTGEQVAIADSLLKRSRTVNIGGRDFRVAAREDRIMICTLQRMYRHFYARLCDIVDTANLVENETIDYEDLRASAEKTGIWAGVSTFLTIVSDYVRAYHGRALDLPLFVRLSAEFGGDKLFFRKEFLRIPILPHAAHLYASQLGSLMRKGEIRSSARLTLLPCLATAAAVGMKLTGSDKGIW
jgi:hypothetical protein